MKNLYKFMIVLGFLFAVPSFYLFAQVGINTDNTLPENTAMLDVKSTAGGLLPPRMTHIQMNAIVNPAHGLIIYCTDCSNTGNGALAMFISGEWQMFSPTCILPLAPSAGTHVPAETQITWNWNAVAAAAGYKWNTVNDYNTATDMFAATTKTETSLSCSTPYTRYIWAYNACGNSTAATLTQTTSACFPCGTSITINHVAGAVAPVAKTVTYGTVTNIPGETSKCWITSNLGADHQAGAVNDATEPSAGWYWQFNRKQGYKHDGTTRTPATTWISSINENSDWISTNDPCTLELGTSWHVPTKAEWTNVDANGNWTNWEGPWNSGLKMHVAGYLNKSDGSLNNRGSIGQYWSSTQGYGDLGYLLAFAYGYSGYAGDYKASCFTARCVRNL